MAPETESLLNLLDDEKALEERFLEETAWFGYLLENRWEALAFRVRDQWVKYDKDHGTRWWSEACIYVSLRLCPHQRWAGHPDDAARFIGMYGQPKDWLVTARIAQQLRDASESAKPMTEKKDEQPHRDHCGRVGDWLYVHGRCHPRSPTWARWNPGTGRLEIRCSVCDELIVAFDGVSRPGTATPPS